MIKMLSREEKALHMVNKKGFGLEIGPSHRPIAPKSKGFNVHIVDHLSKDQLKEKYAGHDLDINNIEDVDFVWDGKPLTELIGMESCYDWIIASHVIEHIPDLITFFQQCELLLKPLGILSLIIPDKRFCFDYFNTTSSTGVLIDAYDQKLTKPSAGQVFDHFANATKNDGTIAWEHILGDVKLIHTLEQAQDMFNCAHANEEYVDVHCWRFTPESFKLILSDLNHLGLLKMNIVAEFERCGCEFFITLGKGIKKSDSDRLVLLQQII